MHPIIKALGAGLNLEIPPAQEAEVLKKILTDNLVTLRAQELMVEFFGTNAIERMNPLEHHALLKRVLPQPKRGVTKAFATWTMHEAFSDGHPYLQAWCHMCGQDLKFPGPSPRVQGNRVGISPNDLTKALDSVTFSHCGHNEKMPADFRTQAERIFQRLVDVADEPKKENENE